MPDYRLEYSDFHLADAEGQRLSPVNMDSLPTIGQIMATRAGQQITIDTRLPGVRTHRYVPTVTPDTADTPDTPAENED